MERCANQFFIYDDEVLKNIDFKENMVSGGKSIYEVIRVIHGVPLFLEKHLERLLNSVKISDLTLNLNSTDIKKNILKLIKINKVETGNIKIVFNYLNEDTRFLAYFLNHSYPSADQYKNGVDTMLFQRERNNPNAKVINIDFRNAVDAAIKEKNVFEAILIDNEGNVTEGSKSNIFMVKGNAVITAPMDAVLPGITRQSILDVCMDLGIEVREEKVNVQSLLSMDGIFISGTSPKVLPVSHIVLPISGCAPGAHPINGSSPGAHPYSGASGEAHFNPGNKIIISIMKAYDEKIDEDIKNYKI